MITSTPLPRLPQRNGRTGNQRLSRKTRGFTLVEVLISAALASWVLSGVLAAFLFLGRSGANIANYNEMESQARRTLERFAQDTRQASAITWFSANYVRMAVDTLLVEYEYADGSFVRRELKPKSPGPGFDVVSKTKLLDGITDFSFRAYNISGLPLDRIGETGGVSLVDAGKKTKQLQISLRASRTSQTVTTATNTVLSARFILRNKRITV